MAAPLTQPEGQSGDVDAGPSTTRRRAFRKLLAAGLIGSSIEWYDFFLYGTAAALVFPKVFFPHSSALTGTLLAFSTFWAGFVARPIGGVLAGHLGDKYGRKPVVVACLAVMGAATFLIGCLPTRGAPSARWPRRSWSSCASSRGSRPAASGAASCCCSPSPPAPNGAVSPEPSARPAFPSR